MKLQFNYILFKSSIRYILSKAKPFISKIRNYLISQLKEAVNFSTKIVFSEVQFSEKEQLMIDGYFSSDLFRFIILSQ